MRRAFVVVIDACGIGALPDAAEYGDANADTLGHVAEAVGGLSLPTMQRLGLGNIRAPLRGIPPAERPVVHGRLHPLGPGKDTTTGHWELMGVVADAPRPTFPQGFPEPIAQLVAQAVNADGVLCNRPYNGVAAIEEYGAAHLETAKPILYTSQDSVLQIAAHEDVLPVERLYAACHEIRRHLEGIGRVIARPFTGEPHNFRRTDGRRDFALPPPERSYLEALQDRDMPVHSVGKVAHVFAHQGIDHSHPGPDNARALAATTALIDDLDEGLVFVNLVDTDQVYGHRQDPEGFHHALQEIDTAVETWLQALRPNDLLVLTADHGVDPTPHVPGTDHTREYAPLLAVFEGHAGRRHDGPMADVGATLLQWLTGAEEPGLPGSSFL